MTRAISLKIAEEDLRKAERSARRRGLSRNAYINRAVRLLNRVDARRQLKEELVAESTRVSGESLEVLRDFEALYGDEP